MSNDDMKSACCLVSMKDGVCSLCKRPCDPFTDEKLPFKDIPDDLENED